MSSRSVSNTNPSWMISKNIVHEESFNYPKINSATGLNVSAVASRSQIMEGNTDSDLCYFQWPFNARKHFCLKMKHTIVTKIQYSHKKLTVIISCVLDFEGFAPYQGSVWSWHLVNNSKVGSSGAIGNTVRSLGNVMLSVSHWKSELNKHQSIKGLKWWSKWLCLCIELRCTEKHRITMFSPIWQIDEVRDTYVVVLSMNMHWFAKCMEVYILLLWKLVIVSALKLKSWNKLQAHICNCCSPSALTDTLHLCFVNFAPCFTTVPLHKQHSIVTGWAHGLLWRY